MKESNWRAKSPAIVKAHALECRQSWIYKVFGVQVLMKACKC